MSEEQLKLKRSTNPNRQALEFESEGVLPKFREPDVEGTRSDTDDLIGASLAGRYEIERCIGRGGMGVVYLASQSTLNREVVVKVLARSLSQEREAIIRFQREAFGLSQLQHPNIVTIYDFGRERELAYIVMEYVQGETLSQFIKSHGAMPFEEFARIAAQILDALAEAHSRGIIHRDIKPSNIMLCARHGHSNFVKVLDFGLAKLVHDHIEVTKKTNLVGSIAFLAPEQILGLEFDQRVDVYALGVLFYYMLTGRK
ncbi:MAG: serine/threonine-protein kinase, partial [Myxococcota bacterium]